MIRAGMAPDGSWLRSRRRPAARAGATRSRRGPRRRRCQAPCPAAPSRRPTLPARLVEQHARRVLSPGVRAERPGYDEYMQSAGSPSRMSAVSRGRRPTGSRPRATPAALASRVESSVVSLRPGPVDAQPRVGRDVDLVPFVGAARQRIVQRGGQTVVQALDPKTVAGARSGRAARPPPTDTRRRPTCRRPTAVGRCHPPRRVDELTLVKVPVCRDTRVCMACPHDDAATP